MENSAFAADRTETRHELHDAACEDCAPDIKQAAREFARHCAEFKTSDLRRSLTQLAVTVIPFLAICAIMLACFEHAYWVSLLLVLPAAGFLIRMFIIQHDCGHGSYFNSRTANDMLGRAISLFTITPYECWRQIHARHHATSGDLNHRGAGDIDTLTVREYLALPWYRRWIYRGYRNPAFILVLGPPLHFLVRQRVPLLLPVSNQTSRNSVMLTNLSLLTFYGGLVGIFGFKPIVMVVLPVWIVASWIGGWLFYVQHQFEETLWDEREGWDFHVAAIMGSSHYDLPGVLQWFTGNIGLHHVHHICAKIPNYRLQECADSAPDIVDVRRLTIVDSLKCINLALWDEEQRRLIAFGDLKLRPAA